MEAQKEAAQKFLDEKLDELEKSMDDFHEGGEQTEAPIAEDEPAEEKSTTKKKKAAPKVVKVNKKKLKEKSEALLKGIINGLATILTYFDMVESSEDLSADLQSNEALSEDMLELIMPIANYIPYLGVAAGAITIGKHVTIHAAKTVLKDSMGSEDDRKSEPK